MSKVPLNEKLALTIDEVAALTGFGRSTIYDLMRRGTLVRRKHGHKTVLLRKDVESYLDSLPKTGGFMVGDEPPLPENP